MLRALTVIFLLLIDLIGYADVPAWYQEPGKELVRRQKQLMAKALSEGEKIYQDSDADINLVTDSSTLQHSEVISKQLQEAEKQYRQSPQMDSRFDLRKLPQPQHDNKFPDDKLLQAGLKLSFANPVPEKTCNPPMVLVSLSMPEEALRALISDVSNLGGVVAFRGIENNDFSGMLTKIRQLTESANDQSAAVIDPTLFQRFEIEQVPVFILPLAPVMPCSEQGCEDFEQVRASGSVSLNYFLEMITRVGDEKAQACAQYWLGQGG